MQLSLVSTVCVMCLLSVKLSCHVSGVQWENECSYESASVTEFKDWVMGQCHPDNPLQTYECNKHWCYADYKYMAKLFAEKPDVLKVFSCISKIAPSVYVCVN